MYLWIKAIHVIAVICWIASLLYVVRLFIYQTENKSNSILTNQFKLMQRKLWKGICNPAMMVAFSLALIMIYLNPGLFKSSWFHLKFSLVILLLIYHIICGRLFRKLSKNTYSMSPKRLRIWNEVATILLSGIVFAVILKNISGALIGMGVITLLVIFGFLIFRSNKRI